MSAAYVRRGEARQAAQTGARNPQQHRRAHAKARGVDDLALAALTARAK